jgi:cell division protease FtsH
MAYAMVAYFGMSETLGNMSYYDSSGNEMPFTKPFSEKTAQDIDSETRRLLREAEGMARGVISEHRDGLTRLAERLLEKEVVFSEDLEEIFGAGRTGGDSGSDGEIVSPEINTGEEDA